MKKFFIRLIKNALLPELNELKSGIESLQKDNLTTNKRLDDLHMAVQNGFTNLQSQVNQAQNQINNTQTQIESIRADIAHINNNINVLSSEKANQNVYIRIEERVHEINEKFNNFTERLAKLESKAS